MEKSYRIHTNVGSDTVLNVNMRQDFDFLEVLSLKLEQKDAYRLHSSNYGVIVGRVLANDAFGIPNAKVSIVIESDDSDPNEMRDIYPYTDAFSRDKNSIRYNLLPDYSDDTCYRVVGTFPRKRYMLDDNVQLEVYDKYWKYTTVTNQSGDYMLFGVPVGGQQLHVDLDLSDIGILSQRPRDFVFKGYDVNEFDSPSQFKESTNLDSLQQIITQNQSVTVYPFWGDPEDGIAAITRRDIQINYKFEPTCVFMGSIVSDNEGNSIGHRCEPSVDNGMNNQLVAGEGTIEMIRKTQDGLVEEFPIKGNALIDSDGVWCYQIPMNLDYVGTDEYGNIAPTDNPKKGIPTRAQVRFRISKTESGDEGFSRHTAKYLVPMNPIFREDRVIPTTQEETGQGMNKMYNFGSNTPQSCFRDLYWNNVYSVKNFIPKAQVAHRVNAPNYVGLKGSNLVDGQNPVPFNKLRIDMPFSFMIVCILFTIVMAVVTMVNFLIKIIWSLRSLCFDTGVIEICPFGVIIPSFGLDCVSLTAGIGEGDNVAYYPGCGCPDSKACKESSCPEEMGSRCTKSSDNSELKDKVQQALALDHKIVKLDFYQDWLNGCLYMPLWAWRKTKKKSYLFGLFTRSAKNEFCSCDREYSRLKTYLGCNIEYNDNSLDTEGRVNDGQSRWHKNNKSWVRYRNGLIKPVQNKDGLTAYYYSAFQPLNNGQAQIPIDQRIRPFEIARLFATDIILLGNLNEDNIYGIPQFFKVLPSTTANIPPIATIRETLSDDNLDEIESDKITEDDEEENGMVVTTGMDWGHNGNEQVPRFKTGLFMDLACTYAGVKAKSCINAERLSELGVNLDTTYNMTYAHGSSDLKTGMIDSDGFISKLELDDLDNRATFATLNHIGFIPQDYQDSISGYTTQVIDENTGYLVPKFKYVYPVDFDGRLQPIMNRYKAGYEQALYDEQDQSYLTFRLGAEKERHYGDNLEGRIRHFYYYRTDWDMPLYNNSFYFYFGINKGNTAIDKFNNLFYAPCYQRSKAPFSFEIDAMGRTYCIDTYRNMEGRAYNGYGYIRFKSEDINTPFSYTLYDSSSNVVVPTEGGMTDTEFVIGGYIDESGNTMMNENGIVKYQTNENPEEEPKPVDNIYGVSGLTNQTYTLEITDGNGRKLSERIELNVPKVSIDFETESLGTKFYSTASTRMDYICNDENKFYGKIRIKGFIVDGFYYYITNSEVYPYDSKADAYRIAFSGVSAIDVEDTGGEATHKEKGNEASVMLRIGAIESPKVGWVKDCLCDTGNTVYRVNGQDSNIAGTIQNFWFTDNGEMKIDEGEGLITGTTTTPINKIPTIYVYQPNRFTMTVSQLCCSKRNGDNCEQGALKELENNTTSDIAIVSNGLNFNAFLNDMPLKFMLGTMTDSTAATVANQSYFYSSSRIRDAKTKGISGWYGLHQEETYRWDMSDNQVLKRNEDMWTDFVNFEDITDHDSKGKILEFKLNSMFSLANAAYVVNEPTTFYFQAEGGKSPILYRNVIPKYSDASALDEIYVLSDGNTATLNVAFPNIVGNNYRDVSSNTKGPVINPWYENKEVGNYFAAFTNNGGYTSKTAVDSQAKVVKAPTNTKVTPRGGEKTLGRDEEGTLSTFGYTYEKEGKYQPYLRGMFVDRRLGYEITLIAPCMANNSVNLYPVNGDKADPREKIWRSARISGITYGGIEMSYDRDYNIVSADTQYNESGDVIGASANTLLEYSYEFADGDSDAKTIYNKPSAETTLWEEDVYGESHNTNGHMLKRFYEAKFVGSDIRNFFWSTFNKKKLTDYSTAASNSATSYNYVYKYPAQNTALYNGDFNRLDVINGNNYPTKRFIDVGNIAAGGSYNLEILNCSYNMSAIYDTDDKLYAEVTDTDGIVIETTFENPITFMPPNSESDDYANVTYKLNGYTESNKYAVFSTSAISLTFIINPVSNNEFDVYNALPKIIKVMPFSTGGYDGITHIKTVTPDGEIDARGGIIDAISDVEMWVFEDITYSIGSLSNIFGTNKDTLTPSGIHIDRIPLDEHGGRTVSRYYYRDNEDESEDNIKNFVKADSSDAQSTKYFLNNLNVKREKLAMFAICVERLYVNKYDDGIKKMVSTFEFSELYDTRPIYININKDLTYVEKKDLMAVEVTETGPQGGGTTEPTTSEGDNYTHVQTMTFDLYFPDASEPVSATCETLLDYSAISYSLKLTDKAYNVYVLNPFEVTAEKLNPQNPEDTTSVVHLKFRWTQEMGIMADREWQGSTRCSLMAKTGSNFIYNLSWFNLVFDSDSQSGYDSDKKTSDYEVGQKYPTKTKILGTEYGE